VIDEYYVIQSLNSPATYGAIVGPPSTNRAAWWRLNTGITITGSGVSQWDDQSGNGNHLLQATDARRPQKQGDGSIIFRGSAFGSDDCIATAPFTLNQPCTIYLLMKQLSWSSTHELFDGNVSGATILRTTAGATPDLEIFAGGSLVGMTGEDVGTYHAYSVIFNGAGSNTQVDNGTITTGDAGASNLGGFILGNRAAQDAAAANIQVKEGLIYLAAHDNPTRASVVAYLLSL
jgi:hypothetical protein